jgi:hypothetical protein
MRSVRGAVFVTGKSLGSVDIVIASDEEEGDCWTRQLEMLFTVVMSVGPRLIEELQEPTEDNAVA